MSPFLAVLDFALKWVLPFGVAAGSFLMLAHHLEQQYLKSNLDIFWHRVVRWMLTIGLAALVISVIVHTKGYSEMTARLHVWVQTLQSMSFFGFIVAKIQLFNVWLAQKWNYWSLIYMRAFSFVYVIGAIVEIYALKWHISFWRAFNVIWPVVVGFPRILLYFNGYQTPLKDKILEGKLKAQLRENLNDSYERAQQGFQDNGKPFEDGAGGTAHTQTIKAVANAMRHVLVKVRTTADGTRTAHILVRQSRETETDRAIEGVLKGLGERISGDSIYFPSDPTYSSEEKGYIFDSSVPYEADEELGSYKAIFVNPFAEQYKIRNNGPGAMNIFWNEIKETLKYIGRLTPYAVYLKITHAIDKKYYRDTSTDKARYKVQQNLDLSVIPTPKDPETGNSMEEQRKLAIQIAKNRTSDLATALNGFGLYGKFKGVKVGGNTAIYEFTLPPDAKLPNDFDKVQNQIGNLLRISEKPIITLKAGVLTVSINNGVNIPISFADMVRNRAKGAANIISGMAGQDALGKPIYFNLGDQGGAVPHAILFGKTGTGKTVLIMTILYSIMSATDPKHLRIAYADGKGNSFEFMKADGAHPNPFTFAPPADASGDVNYARAIIIEMEKETRRRVELFKQRSVSKLAGYNKLMEKEGKEILPEILFVCDEFSAITQQDRNLTGRDMITLNTIDRFEYIAKMSRSVGIRLLLANQSARKELVPGKISANIPGRVSLGVSEPVEAEIALPETGIKVNLVSQPGEFYSIMNGAAHPEHGNSPYLPDDVMYALNDSLTKKFGQCKYVMTREEIMKDTGLDTKENEGKGEEGESSDTSMTNRLGTHGTSRVSARGTSQLSARGTGRVSARRSAIAKKMSEKSTSSNAPETVLQASTLKPKTALTGNEVLSALRKREEDYPYFSVHFDEIIENNARVQSELKDERRAKGAQMKIDDFKKRIDRYLKRNNIRIEDDRHPDQAHNHSGETLAKVVNAEHSQKI